MAKFSFQNNNVSLDFGNVKYDLEYDDNNIDIVDNIAYQIRNQKEDVKFDDIYTILYDGITELLGEGAVEEIFEGREISAIRLSEVIYFIINEFNKKQNSLFNVNVNANKAQTIPYKSTKRH